MDVQYELGRQRGVQKVRLLLSTTQTELQQVRFRRAMYSRSYTSQPHGGGGVGACPTSSGSPKKTNRRNDHV